MPIDRGSVTFSRFRAQPPGKARDHKQWILDGLKLRTFEPIDRKTGEESTAGFVEVENHDATEFSAGALFRGEWALLAWRTDVIKVPASAVKAQLEKWAHAFEKEQGRPPKKVEKAERRQLIQQALRSKTEPKTRVVDVSWNLGTGELLIWASSRKQIEETRDALEKSFSVELSPQVAAGVAAALGLDGEALSPTAELANVDGAALEVIDGQA